MFVSVFLLEGFCGFVVVGLFVVFMSLLLLFFNLMVMLFIVDVYEKFCFGVFEK